MQRAPDIVLVVLFITLVLFGMAEQAGLASNVGLTLIVCVLMALGLISGVLAAWRNRPELRLAQVLLGRLVMVGVPVALIVALPLITIAGKSGWDVPIRQALIAATVVAAGWAVTFSLQEFRMEADRAERRRDIQRSLRTEIELYFLDFKDVDWAGQIAKAEDLFRDPKYVPFVSRRNRDKFLSVVLERVEVLTDEQIVPVMRYYELAERLEQMAEDFRSRQFASLGLERRRKLFLRYLEMERTCVSYAKAAIESLSSQAYVADLSKTDRARSDRAGEA